MYKNGGFFVIFEAGIFLKESDSTIDAQYEAIILCNDLENSY